MATLMLNELNYKYSDNISLTRTTSLCPNQRAFQNKNL